MDWTQVDWKAALKARREEIVSPEFNQQFPLIPVVYCPEGRPVKLTPFALQELRKRNPKMAERYDRGMDLRWNPTFVSVVETLGKESCKWPVEICRCRWELCEVFRLNDDYGYRDEIIGFSNQKGKEHISRLLRQALKTTSLEESRRLISLALEISEVTLKQLGLD